MANVNVLSELLDISINYFKTCNIYSCTIATLMCHTNDFIKSRVTANSSFAFNVTLL